MNLRTQTKYAVYIISVLTASFMRMLISKIISKYIPEGTYLSVLIDMLIIILVFIPIIRLIEKFVKRATNEYLKTAKNISSNRRKGLRWALAIAFLALFILFALVKYELNFILDTYNYILKIFSQFG